MLSLDVGPADPFVNSPTARLASLDTYALGGELLGESSVNKQAQF